MDVSAGSRRAGGDIAEGEGNFGLQHRSQFQDRQGRRGLIVDQFPGQSEEQRSRLIGFVLFFGRGAVDEFLSTLMVKRRSVARLLRHASSGFFEAAALTLS